MSGEGRAGAWTKGKILGLAAAVVIPAVLTFLFWRTTPTVGGWSAKPEPSSSAAPSAGYLHSGGLPAALYQQNCARCHGSSLAGTDKVPALRRSQWPYAQNRDLLIKIIHEGRGLTMPGFEGKLSNQQIESLADFLQKENAVQ